MRLRSGDVIQVQAGSREQEVVGERSTHVYLDAGAVRATVAKREPGTRFRVLTPHLRATAVGTRFTVWAGKSGSRVLVEEGRVWIERAEGNVLLGPGESATAAGAEEGREGAPRELAAWGGGLAAGNALFEAGLLDRKEGRVGSALAQWRRYQTAFPDGPLAPEVSLHILEALLSSGQFARAQEEADAFEARFADGLVAARLTLEKLGLWRGPLNHLSDVVFARAEQGVDP